MRASYQRAPVCATADSSTPWQSLNKCQKPYNELSIKNMTNWSLQLIYHYSPTVCPTHQIIKPIETEQTRAKKGESSQRLSEIGHHII